MNEPATVSELSKIDDLKVRITGKLVAEYSGEKGYISSIQLKSKDEYSSGPTLEIYSEKSLGQLNQIVTVTAEVGGYRTKRKTSDGKDFYRTRNTLQA